MAKLYLKKYGHRVLSNGFEVVAITPGTKFPTYDYSSETLPKITHKHLDKLLSNGHAKDGVGIRTRFTPLLDLDIQDVKLRDLVIKFAEDTIGYAPVRVGNAPKVGLMFRSTTTFKKVQSKAFTDAKGRKCQVEFLGDGQQFVALAIHPDTKKPYRWPDKMNPVNMEWADLPTVTAEQAQAVVDYFTELCVEREFTIWKKNKKASTALVPARGDEDDIAGTDTSPLPLTIDEVREWVARLPNDESVEYEDSYGDDLNYRNVIFAIWHQTEGSEEGREIAEEWSEKSPKHEQEEGRFYKLWHSADPEDREHPVTFRYIIKQVLQIEGEAKRELRDGYIESLKDIDNVDDLKEIVSKIKKTHFEDLDLGQLSVELKKAAARVGIALTPAAARKMLMHKPAGEELPGWVRPWRYIQHTRMFYNSETGLEISREAFDASFSRYLDGSSASFFALNMAQIKAYWNTMYKPDDDEEFVFQGYLCINTFSDRLMPAIPERLTEKDHKAIKRVQRHLEHVLPNERERAIFISFLAYIVQTRQRPNWAVVLQGVDGDGKSFFGEMMGAVLGSNNVRMLDAQQLEDRYTAWAVGQLFTFIEELKLHGHSRYDILNKIKPFITNNAINVHPKNVNPYTALNTTAYMATTNFMDALPVNDNDRRYFILKSAWQSGEALREFLSDHPDYFKRLFGTLRRPGALRKWLMEYELHEEFDPKSRAPLTAARQEMIDLSKSEAQVTFEDAIADDRYPRIGPELVVSSALVGHVQDAAGEVINTRTVSSLLSSHGYVKLPFRHRLDSGSDNVESIWVKGQASFMRSAATQSAQRSLVLKFLKNRQKKLDL